MPSVNCNGKVVCETCGTQIRKRTTGQHTEGCSAGTRHCTQCLSFSTMSQAELSYYHIAEKQCIATQSDARLSGMR